MEKICIRNTGRKKFASGTATLLWRAIFLCKSLSKNCLKKEWKNTKQLELSFIFLFKFLLHVKKILTLILLMVGPDMAPQGWLALADLVTGGIAAPVLCANVQRVHMVSQVVFFVKYLPAHDADKLSAAGGQNLDPHVRVVQGCNTNIRRFFSLLFGNWGCQGILRIEIEDLCFVQFSSWPLREGTRIDEMRVHTLMAMRA
jgi:hypothetical protein